MNKDNNNIKLKEEENDQHKDEERNTELGVNKMDIEVRTLKR